MTMLKITRNVGRMNTIERIAGATGSAHALKASQQRKVSQGNSVNPRDAHARTPRAKNVVTRTVAAGARKGKKTGAETAQLDAVALKNDF